MPHFLIVLMLYINLLNISWIKMSIFVEYGAFNLVQSINIAQYKVFYQPKSIDFFLISQQKYMSWYSEETPH